jgi:hypothetical protein
MTVTYLASGDAAVEAGYLAAMFAIAILGLALLIAGLRRRSPARAGSAGTALIIVGAVVLALGGLGIAGRLATAASRTVERSRDGARQLNLHDWAPSLRIGQCISEFNFRSGVLTSTADCEDPGSAYELAATVGPAEMCPDGKREGSVYDRLAIDSATLCFVLNLKQGQCYMRLQGGPAETLSPIDCTDKRFAQVSVTQRVDGTTDTTRCPAGVRAVAYPAPARLYCLSQAGV